MRYIENELMKRIGRDDEVDALLGAEIKYRRSAMSKTLFELCARICSISYLSKLENNEIRPNPKMLESICKRVHISKQNLQTIKESKKLFVQCMVAYMNEDNDTLIYVYNLVKDMKNYRAKIIRLFFLIYTRNDVSASKIIAELEKSVSAIPNQDLLVLTMLEAFHLFNLNMISESFKLVTIMNEFISEFEECALMTKHLVVDIFERINSPLIIEACDDLKKFYFDVCELEKAHKVNDRVNLFFLKNGYLNKIRRIKDPKNKIKYEIYLDAISGSKREYDIKTYDFSLGFYLYNTNKELFVETLDQYKNRLSSVELLVLQMLKDSIVSDDFAEKADKIYMKKFLEIKDLFLIEYAFRFVVKSLSQKAKYKRIAVLYGEMMKLEQEFKGIC